MTTTTYPQGRSVDEPTLYVGLELGQRSWTVAMTSGLMATPWLRGMAPGDWPKLRRLLGQARQRFGLPATAPVVSCYEAGRDGFWVHRALVVHGIGNRVVDSSSIEVNRRARRNKSDRMDGRKLVVLLVRVCSGDRTAWREVHVPAVHAEAARHVGRERADLVTAQTRLINQMRGWLATLGAPWPAVRRGAWWTQVRDWAGLPLPPEVEQRLARAWARLAQVRTQIAELNAEQSACVTAAAVDSPAHRLRRLKALGVTSVSTLLGEGLIWRAFRNRRQVGGILGFAPMHYASGQLQRDHGISHAGNAWLQSTVVELAWRWIRWQPDSPLTRWYLARFGASRRARRIGIVAVARKLLIALWRYATTGVVPSGARLKAA